MRQRQPGATAAAGRHGTCLCVCPARVPSGTGANVVPLRLAAPQCVPWLMTSPVRVPPAFWQRLSRRKAELGFAKFARLLLFFARLHTTAKFLCEWVHHGLHILDADQVARGRFLKKHGAPRLNCVGVMQGATKLQSAYRFRLGPALRTAAANLLRVSLRNQPQAKTVAACRR